MEYYKKALSILFLILFLFNGCKNDNLEQKGSPSYITSIEEWQKDRITNLKSADGWLNLVGLYWLKPGDNKFGTDLGNDIVFPRGMAPGVIGTFSLNDGVVSVNIIPGVRVICNGQPVSEMTLQDDMSGNPTVLELGYLRWFIIKRGDMYGVRVRDLNAPMVRDFKGIETFPINEDWRITAKLSPNNPPKIITVQSVIGTSEHDTVNASLVFSIKGKEYRLDPLVEGNQFFIIFADETNGEETYGAGRFLYADQPDAEGNVILDFNKAYNPPCTFTEYATCPLPPKQNYLPIKITAGEKKYKESD